MPGPDEVEHSQRLTDLIRGEIEAGDGAISFDRFMDLALYAPGLGYYVAGCRKLGADGDFVTAPEISPFFARCLAQPFSRVLSALNGGAILEFGAGSGALAAGLLAELERLGTLPQRYSILELSPELRVRQRIKVTERVPHLATRIEWLDRLPEQFDGVVVANEVLDAMPVSRFRIDEDGLREGHVGWSQDGFRDLWLPPRTPGLATVCESIASELGRWPRGYQSEVNLRADAWVAALAGSLGRAVAFLIDYGFPRRELYHPERSMGTLMCHYRHRAHGDPYRGVGLQDITAHVDFSGLAKAAAAAGLDVLGYSSQAQFLLDCGLDRLLAEEVCEDAKEYLARAWAVKRLVFPDEMGEAFKVLAIGAGWRDPIPGFGSRNLVDRL